MKYDIYRCSAGFTLDTVNWLRERHIRAWVPQQVIRRRLPRTKRKITVTKAAIPGYVFIPQFDMSAPVFGSAPGWSRLAPLWTVGGAQATCGQDELTEMQEVINGAGRDAGSPIPREEPRPQDLAAEWVGQLVIITTGPFSGFGGVVIAVDDEGTATIDMKNTMGNLKIPSCLLAIL